MKRRLIHEIRIQQMELIGLLTQKGELENLALTGKKAGKKSTNRRGVLWMNILPR